MAIKRINATLLCLFMMVSGLYAQDDPVLFSVEGTPVHASEFKYIYSKTNGEKADFGKESLEEYLNLYTRFKLKVKAAQDMKLDTIPALINELGGYQRQLSKSYLIDRELTEKLVKEAYDRSQEEVNISHILIRADRTAAPKDSLVAYKKIIAIKKELDGGADFVKVVKAKSDDVSSRQFGGKIGYFTALQLPNLYELESAAYNTPVGKYSNPIRTNLGYHIVMVNERQPARGEINAAHILVRASGKAQEAAAKAKIDAIYKELKGGASFSDLAKTKSEDKKTAGKGGELGFFGINIYEPSIENAAFALKEIGDYSEPFQSSLGYHIIMKLGEKEKLPYETAKNILLQKVKKDSRYKITEQAMIDRIKTESNFKENTANIDKFTKGLDKDFFVTTWEKPKTGLNNPVYTIGKQTVTLGDYVDFLIANRNLRFRMNRGGNTAEKAAKSLFNDFVNDGVIKYEESQLGVKYPEFKSLMREYEEGILLFEATKREVWDKAAADSVGLQAFFEKNKGMYNWNERARVSVYTVKVNEEKVIAKARKLAAKKSASSVLAKINKGQDFVVVKEERYEKGRNKDVDAMAWKAGTVGELKDNRGTLSFIKIEEIISGSPKTLKEARGYVVADYQDYLEKKWVEDLRKKYKVDINKNVLNDMMR